MLTRKIGRTDLEVSALCLGGNVFGWTIDEATSFAVLDTYVQGGGNFIDTANVYSAWVPGHSGGESETILGKWMAARKNREQVIIATKIGMQMGDGKRGLSRDYILQEVDASLRRLQTDYIDLYQAHSDDTNTPLEETLGAFNELIKAGKVRYIGASNYTAERMAEALGISLQHHYDRYECIQPPYNLLNRATYEKNLEALCKEQEISVITYSSLASGFLTGKYQPRQALPESQRAQGVQSNYMNEKGFAVLAQVEEIARTHQATPSQVALAWIIGRPGITAPIASATSVEQTQELLNALNLRITQEEGEHLDKVSGWH
ncbi:aldo/keto reductase [Dictyobacter arantiisoli]|uniref:Oxidoreductase n=1 Tax=Dictyobacter arantiisoli TaxID=2014874 RepID=A0A5A5TC57_9CHLR|nr:aldo/keto reductase [Dictyobacter arantiisoli]GCF09091.1 oxidoreductase [Dictyobacter arantiisoli]